MKSFSSLMVKKNISYIVLTFAVLAVALVRFALMPAMADYRATTEKNEALRQDIIKAEALLQRIVALEAQKALSRQELDSIYQQFIPPSHAPLSWSAQQVYNLAKEAGVKIESLSEISGWGAPWIGQPANERRFNAYAIRVELNASYHELLSLIKELEHKNPYLCVLKLTILGRERDPVRHYINLVIEWPILATTN